MGAIYALTNFFGLATDYNNLSKKSKKIVDIIPLNMIEFRCKFIAYYIIDYIENSGS